MPDPQPATYRDIIQHEAKAAGIPPELAFAIVDTESSGRGDALGPPVRGQQASGFFQLMPETAKGYGVNPADPYQNIQGGIRYLSDLNKQYGGDVEKILSAYHGGPDVAQHGPITRGYVQSVMGRLGGGAAAPATSSMAGGVPSSSISSAGAGSALQPGIKHKVSSKPPAPGVPGPTPLPRYGSPTEPPPAPTTTSAEFPGLGPALSELPGKAMTVGRDVLAGLDPRTPQGQRNLAATAAAAGATWYAGGVGAVPVLAGVGGAMAAGALTTGAQQAAGTAPPDSLGPTGEAFAQGAGQLAGEGISRAIWAIPKRPLAAKIAKVASAKVVGAEDVATETLTQELARAKTLLPARSARAAGEEAKLLYQGPVKSTQQRMGEAVGAAAASGPDVPTAPIRAQLDRLAAQMDLPVTTQPPTAAAVAPTLTKPAKQMTADEVRAYRAELDAYLKTTAADLAAGGEHPLPAMLGRAQALLDKADEAGLDTIPFETAHKLKLKLDEVVNWEAPAKKQVEQMTKALRGTVRKTMAGVGHQPYEKAAADYEWLAERMGSDYGDEFRKAIGSEPAKASRIIKDQAPQQTQFLRELLVDAAGPPGSPARVAGEQTWDKVRAVWAKENIIEGDPTQLTKRLTSLDDDFTQEFFHSDPRGRAVYNNLAEIGQTYDKAIAEGKLRRARFQGTSLYADKMHNALQSSGADIIRAIALGPGSFWGAYSIGRLLQGPASKELIEWSAFNEGTTPLLVNVMTSPYPGQAMAALMRRWYDDHPEDVPKSQRPQAGASQTTSGPPRMNEGPLSPPPPPR